MAVGQRAVLQLPLVVARLAALDAALAVGRSQRLGNRRLKEAARLGAARA